MYWVINGCCNLVRLFRWTITQSCIVAESEYWNLGVPLTDTKSFVSSLILYIYGRKAAFPSNELKIMFALSYIQGGKAQYWKNEAINLIAAGQELFKDFKDFIAQMEAQFGDPSPKATTMRKQRLYDRGSLQWMNIYYSSKLRLLKPI